jgi:hypothetical protein
VVQAASGSSVVFELSTLEPRIHLRLDPIRDLNAQGFGKAAHPWIGSSDVN